jgi:hypothetical protein
MSRSALDALLREGCRIRRQECRIGRSCPRGIYTNERALGWLG